MRRIIGTTIGVLVLAAIGWLWTRPALIGDGGYQLRLQFKNESAIQSIRCVKFGTWEKAELAAAAEQKILPQLHNEWTTVVDPFTQNPVEIRIDTSQHLNHFGYEISAYQTRGLVVRAAFKDGRIAIRAVEIPDGSVKRDLTIDLH